ncbi:hypothetical protein Rsub_02749 [Raphidocelis subcapitata]|uniref:Pherophorin domain-containing protein n=1 Tax=Raphidocelis subcapitata TaxID=307507 RepID=A0A2V0NQX4_9CHLO|nr:hypothetical protein Rsub_02749 [Raphidocelis subcapitata]|eukprot:GBF90041.1 hypothetical protein Rsub_02749 [Raphidocelis subcapitata]
MTGGGHRGPPPLLVLAVCWAAALAGLPRTARAACQVAEQSATNFQIRYDAGSPTRACFSLSTNSPCGGGDGGGACCLEGAAELRELLLAPNALNPACVDRRGLKALRFTVDGVPIRSKPGRSKGGQTVVKASVKGAFPNGASICIDASDVPGCDSIQSLCGSPGSPGSPGSCSFKLQARGAPRGGSGDRAKCCIDAAAEYNVSAPQFNLELVNQGVDFSFDSDFEAARDRWQRILTVDLPDVTAKEYNGTGFEWEPGYSMPIDDVVIFYKVEYIDGANGSVLGAAGVKYRRKGGRSLPLVGQMLFDAADLAALPPRQRAALLLHEMGHALGLGLEFYWRDVLGCVRDCLAGQISQPAYYTCANAAREFAALPGCGPKLPVETELGLGSGCRHWQEDALGSELMTPVLGASGMQGLSRVTIGALEDIYGPGSVDYTQADPWDCRQAAKPQAAPAARRAFGGEGEVVLLEPLPPPQLPD